MENMEKGVEIMFNNLVESYVAYNLFRKSGLKEMMNATKEDYIKPIERTLKICYNIHTTVEPLPLDGIIKTVSIDIWKDGKNEVIAEKNILK